MHMDSRGINPVLPVTSAFLASFKLAVWRISCNCLLDVATLIEHSTTCKNFLKIFKTCCNFARLIYNEHVPTTFKENMKPQDLINHFGSPTKAAAAIDVTSQTVLNWIEKGVIPMNAQKAIAYDTKGKLKPDLAVK